MSPRVSTLVCISCLSLAFVSSAWSKPEKLDQAPKILSVQGPAQEMPAPIPENVKTSTITGTYTGSLASVETDAKGAITQLVIYARNPPGVLAFDGCGAKLSDLPQLLWSHHHVDTDDYRISLELTVKTKGRCIDRLSARRVYSYRYDIMLNAIHDQLKTVISTLKDMKKRM